MYAVVRTGGKQYRLGVGDNVKVEKLPDEVGNIVELSQILMVSDGGCGKSWYTTCDGRIGQGGNCGTRPQQKNNSV